MGFVLNPCATETQWDEWLRDLPSSKLGERLRDRHARSNIVAEDRTRNACLFKITSTNLVDNYSQLHYVLKVRDGFFDVRTLAWYDRHVSFYDFPAAWEDKRHFVTECFVDAAPIYGFFGEIDLPEDNRYFVPIFMQDNWVVDKSWK